MKIDVDVSIEVDLPEGVDPAGYVKWWVGMIEAIVEADERCVGWQVEWEPTESYP